MSRRADVNEMLGNTSIWYNAIMRGVKTLKLTVVGLVALFSGCASTTHDMPPQQEGPSFTEIKAAPDSYKGQQVVLGGQVLGARRLKEGTRIEVLQLPVEESQQPGGDLTRSQGRFVGLHKEFLDPATLPPGTLITVTGEVMGSIILPLDETDYAYPVIEIRQLKVSPHNEGAPINQMRRMSPYWGPYWRPYPYW